MEYKLAKRARIKRIALKLRTAVVGAEMTIQASELMQRMALKYRKSG